MTLFCPHCGVQNADDANICTACQTQLPRLFAAAGVTQPIDGQTQAISGLLRRSASGGNWFYWIAGMSLVNTVIGLFHGSLSFVLGLGVTQFIDAGIKQLGGGAALPLLLVNFAFAGVYALFGYFACRRAVWAFVAGIVCYSLDTLLFLLVKDIFGLAFHVYALFCIVVGLRALKSARKLEAQQAQTLVRY